MKLDRPITVNLGRAIVSLLFNFNAMVALEDATGGDLASLLVNLKARPIANTRILIWAGIQHERPGCTLQEVGDMIDISNLAEIAKTLNTAMSENIGTNEGGGESEPADPPKVVAIDGGGSGPSDATTAD